MSPILRTLVFTILVPGTVTVFIPVRILGYRHGALGETLRGFAWLGFFPLVAGVAIYLVCAWSFATEGMGTPAPTAPPLVLVRIRLYQKVRNPMYLGVLLILFSESLAFKSGALAVYAGGVWLLFHLFVVIYEEPHLRAQFGPSYEEYLRGVPRWRPKFRRK